MTIVWVAVVGCQRYSAEPLDLAAHEAAWSGRDPAAASLAEYARRLSSVGGGGAAYDPSDGLSLREAEVVALFFNPQLRAARARAKVRVVGAREAGRWEDPELNVDVERILESVEEPWVIGGMLSFTLPLSGRLRAEKDLANAEADAARTGVLVEEAGVVAELHERWVELAVVEQRIDVTRRFLEEVDAVAQNAERLRAAGELDPVDARMFTIEQVRRRGELRVLEVRRRVAEAAVKAAMGLRPEAPVRLVASWPRAIEVVEAEWVEGHPKVAQARAEYEVAERTLAAEVRKQWPDLAVGGGFGTDEGEERLLGGLTVPLPAFNANRRAIAEARASRDAARAAAEGAYEEVAGGAARARVAIEAARVRREFVEKELAPLVDGQLREVRRLGRLGDASTVILLEVLTRAYEARVELIEAVEAEAEAVNELNALVRPAAVREEVRP